MKDLGCRPEKVNCQRRRHCPGSPDRDVRRPHRAASGAGTAAARRWRGRRRAVRRRRSGRRADHPVPGSPRPRCVRAADALPENGAVVAGGRRHSWCEQARGEARPRAVARLISLVEGASPQLREVMAALAPLTGNAYVVGLTGSPGVGKSTSTSALVTAYRKAGKRVGVLAVDPSSPFSGGALLGDRVRMSEHASDPGVYIRSMATRGHLGGLAWAAPQAIRVLDAAGCDVVLVETVGVGQSEVEIASQADTSVVLLAPGHGRRHPGRQGGNPGDRRRLRGQQGRPGRRRRHRPRAQPHAGPGRVPGPRRLAAADRQDRRRARRGRGRGRRGAGEAPGLDGGARRAGRAAPRPRGP